MEGQDVVTPSKRKRSFSSVFGSGKSSRSRRSGFTLRTRRLRTRGVTRRSSTKTKSLNKVASIISHPAMRKQANLGFTMNAQFASNVTTGSAAAGLVHNTCPTYYTRFVLFAALARKIFNAWNFKIYDWNEVASTAAGVPAPSNAGTGDSDVPPNNAQEYYVCILYWKESEKTDEDWRQAIVVYNGESYYTFVYKLMNRWYDATNKQINYTNSLMTGFPNVNLHFVRCLKRTQVALSAGQTETYHDIDVIDSTVHISSHSVLKYQNRSKTTSTDITSDDIDLLPLVGKSYSGTGNGAILKVNQTDAATSKKSFPSLTCNALVGYSTFAVSSQTNIPAPGTLTTLQKPPPKGAFKRVTQSGASSLAPGEIDNSLLTYSGSKKFNVWLKLLQPGFRPNYWNPADPAPSNTLNAYCPIVSGTQGGTVGQAVLKVPFDFQSADSGVGKFRMFFWEKQINSIAPDANNNISVHFEHDFKLGAYMTTKKKKFTQCYNLKSVSGNLLQTFA